MLENTPVINCGVFKKHDAVHACADDTLGFKPEDFTRRCLVGLPGEDLFGIFIHMFVILLHYFRAEHYIPKGTHYFCNYSYNIYLQNHKKSLHLRAFLIVT